ncbi:unnamed protein product, partial [Oppiella nova]
MHVCWWCGFVGYRSRVSRTGAQGLRAQGHDLNILKPSEKKAKYQYGGLNSGRPVTPPRGPFMRYESLDHFSRDNDIAYPSYPRTPKRNDTKTQ